MGEPAGHAERRAALAAAHGPARPYDRAAALRLTGLRGRVHPHDTVAFLYRDAAAAAAWAAANAEHYGHPCLATAPAAGGVVGVLDLRPSLAAHGCPPTDPALPDHQVPGPRRAAR